MATSDTILTSVESTIAILESWLDVGQRLLRAQLAQVIVLRCAITMLSLESVRGRGGERLATSHTRWG